MIREYLCLFPDVWDGKEPIYLQRGKRYSLPEAHPETQRLLRAGRIRELLHDELGGVAQPIAHNTPSGPVRVLEDGSVVKVDISGGQPGQLPRLGQLEPPTELSSPPDPESRKPEPAKRRGGRR